MLNNLIEFNISLDFIKNTPRECLIREYELAKNSLERLGDNPDLADDDIVPPTSAATELAFLVL